MTKDCSVPELLAATRQGDATAPDRLFDRYFPKLVTVARGHLAGMPSSAADEEDVALSVMNSFFEALQCDHFPDLHDHSSLARLLFRMTIRKAADYRRHENRAKRGGGRRLLSGGEASSELHLNRAAAGEEIAPEFIAMMRETLDELLAALGDAELQNLVVAKLAGCTNAEVAEELDCSVSTVERRLRLIRRVWSPDERNPKQLR